MPRQSIDVGGFGHQNPIPAATRLGPLLVTSIIAPFDPGTRNVPADATAQIENIFTHAGAILDAAGATWDDVVKFTFYVEDISSRDLINEPWKKRFPNPESRPSRHTMLALGGPAVRGEFMAYIER